MNWARHDPIKNESIVPDDRCEVTNESE
uniref:Uncharacterized protein n=1 Tax=Ralstonia solanacearum TaxID=305 RepID=A0A0S4WEB8_RALSL|nr:protein of unknown function [Ralstonia solanacearum]